MYFVRLRGSWGRLGVFWELSLVAELRSEQAKIRTMRAIKMMAADMGVSPFFFVIYHDFEKESIGNKRAGNWRLQSTLGSPSGGAAEG